MAAVALSGYMTSKSSMTGKLDRSTLLSGLGTNESTMSGSMSLNFNEDDNFTSPSFGPSYSDLTMYRLAGPGNVVTASTKNIIITHG